MCGLTAGFLDKIGPLEVNLFFQDIHAVELVVLFGFFVGVHDGYDSRYPAFSRSWTCGCL